MVGRPGFEPGCTAYKAAALTIKLSASKVRAFSKWSPKVLILILTQLNGTHGAQYVIGLTGT